MREFKAVSVLVTENCNLACKYCYEALSTGHRDVRMTPETAVRTVEFIFEQAKETNEISITFFGGEPTLMPEIIDIMCTRGKVLAKQFNKRFNVSIITNATVMNKKLYDIISKHLDIWTTTQLSVDGPWDIQDEYRVTKSGKGTFATIEKNIKYWKTLFPNNLNVHGVLNKKSIPKLFESYLYFKNIWKEDRLWFLTAKSDDYTEEDVKLYDREMRKIYDYIMERVRKTKNDYEVEAYAPLDRALNEHSLGKPCGVGETYCTVTAKGDIWPCHHFYYIDEDQEMCLGNVWDGLDENKKRLWDEYDQNDMIGCDGCDHNACYRCPAENYEEYGSPFMQIKGFHCDFMKIDLKYQRMIRKELQDMGLMGKSNDLKSDDNACSGYVRDCVGKQGDCDIVVDARECKFERTDSSDNNGVTAFEDVSPNTGDQSEKQVVPETKIDTGCDGCKGCGVETTETTNSSSVIKDIVNDMIEVLIKHHNKL